MDCKDFGLITVIMAAYNAEKTIEQAIDSVLSQTYPQFELIVVDDASKDQTIEIVEELAERDNRIRLIANEENRGVSYTRKRGLDEANGLWIAILDSDDVWMPEKLEKQVQHQKETGADIIYTGSKFMDALGKPIDRQFYVPDTISYRQLLKQNVISNSSALVRKQLYEKYYAAGDNMHEDFATWLLILKSGGFARGINEPFLIYRLSPLSKSGNKIKSAKMNWITYRYIGLNILQAAYYEAWYIRKNIIKYINILGSVPRK